MGIRYSQSKYAMFRYGPSETGFQFKVQISDSAGTVVHLLNNEVKELSWNYNRIGGCGDFSMTLKREYDDFDGLTADDLEEIYDLQIWITSELGGSSTLYYRGFITNIRPNLLDGEETNVEGVGYGTRLDQLQVHDGTGAPKEYTTKTITQIVNQLFTDFVDGNCEVVAGTVDTFATPTIESIKFNGTVSEALDKLASFVNAEWGVDKNLALFFQARSTTISNRWTVGYDISELEDELNYGGIVNKLYIEGGDIDGTPYRYVATNQASIDLYGLREKRISNSSVVSDTVASVFAASEFATKATYLRNTRIKLPFNKSLIESATPVPLATIIKDPEPYTRQYGTFKYGAGAYCGETEYRISSISYFLKDASLETTVELNDGKPDLEAKFDLLDFQLEQQRQASGV